MSDFDWQSFIFDAVDGWMDRLLARARRRFHPDETLAEEAHTYAFEKLSENGWERLQGYGGRSKPGTYLITVYNRLLEDFDRGRFGRVRPPAWLSRRGDPWLRAWEFLCLQRKEPETVVDWLCAHGERAPDNVREMVREIKARIPTCGQTGGKLATVSLADTDNVTGGRGNAPAADDAAELEALLLAASRLLADSPPAAPASAEQRARAAALAGELTGALDTLESELAVSARERRLLRLQYEAGHGIAQIGRALGEPEHRVRRDLKAVRARIASAFERNGVTRELLRGLLDG